MNWKDCAIQPIKNALRIAATTSELKPVRQFQAYKVVVGGGNNPSNTAVCFRNKLWLCHIWWRDRSTISNLLVWERNLAYQKFSQEAYKSNFRLTHLTHLPYRIITMSEVKKTSISHNETFDPFKTSSKFTKHCACHGPLLPTKVPRLPRGWKSAGCPAPITPNDVLDLKMSRMSHACHTKWT